LGRIEPQRVLVTGVSGSGKTTLIERLRSAKGPEYLAYNLVDLDRLGSHVMCSDGKVRWVINNRALQPFFETGVPLLAMGLGTNLFESQTVAGYQFDPEVGKAVPAKILAKPIAYAWDWTIRVVLTYEPTEAELTRRWAKRRNPFGKDPKTRAEVVAYAIKMHEHPPSRFVQVKNTGRTLDWTLQVLKDIVQADAMHSEFGLSYDQKVGVIQQLLNQAYGTKAGVISES